MGSGTHSTRRRPGCAPRSRRRPASRQAKRSTMATPLTDTVPTDEPATPGAVLDVQDLNVRFPTEDGVVHAVRGVSFSLRPGEVLGIVGESGSGKSVTSMAVMGLLPASAQVTGSVKFRDRQLLGLDD